MRKRWADTDLEFFLVQTCWSTWSSTQFKVPQNLELVNFLLLTSSLIVFFWRLAVDSSKSSPHLHLSCQEQEHQLPFVHAHEISNLQFPLVIFSLVIQRLISPLLIYFFLLNCLWTDQLRYIFKFLLFYLYISVCLEVDLYSSRRF